MFIILAAFVGYSLLTFGAILPNSWFLLDIAFSAAAATVLLVSVIRRKNVDLASVMALFVIIALPALFHPRLSIGFSAGIFAWVAARRSTTNTLRFLRFLVLIGVLEATLGLIQYFVSPGWILGYVNQAYRVSGTLINHNHFAGLLELLIPPAFGMAYIIAYRFCGMARSYTYLLAAAFMGLALLFSVSRMGILSFLATLVFVGILLHLQDLQRRIGLIFIVTVGGLVVIAAFWIGIDAIVQRYSLLLGEDAVLREGRIIVFRDTVKMIRAYPAGIGTGNFLDRFREFQTFQPNLLFDHAHNEYLETAAEWSMPLAALFWAGIIFAIVRAVRLFRTIEKPEQQGVLLACIAGTLSILIHGLADFNLEIPSNAMLFFSFVGILLAMTNEPKSDGKIRERLFSESRAS